MPMPSVTRDSRMIGYFASTPRNTSAISAEDRLRVLDVPILIFIERMCVPLLCMLAKELSESAWPKVALSTRISGTASTMSA